ncbi:hypothetical protein NL676_038673 [Syzygium grande]|nr:hypothetical protein NL676_038673 [Syzygium grande]
MKQIPAPTANPPARTEWIQVNRRKGHKSVQESPSIQPPPPFAEESLDTLQVGETSTSKQGQHAVNQPPAVVHDVDRTVCQASRVDAAAGVSVQGSKKGNFQAIQVPPPQATQLNGDRNETQASQGILFAGYVQRPYHGLGQLTHDLTGDGASSRLDTPTALPRSFSRRLWILMHFLIRF